MTTWDVVIVLMIFNFPIGCTVGVLVGLAVPGVISLISYLRNKYVRSRLESNKLLIQNDREKYKENFNALSFLTVIQSLQLPSSKVSKMIITR